MKRLYVGRQLDVQDEPSALNRRQAMSIVHPTADSRDLRPRRDWKFIGAVCAGIAAVAVFIAVLVRVI